MSISVKVEDKTGKVIKLVGGRTEKAVREAAFRIEARAKTKARVDTGNMRNSIHANGNGSMWRVDSPAEYSIYNEFGTRYKPAQPLMRPSLEEVKPWLIKELRMVAR